MCADLQEHPVPCIDQLSDRVVEQHGLADVPVPIPGIELRAHQPSAGHGGEERRRCRARPDSAQAFEQLLLELLHLRAVIRNVHLQRAAEDVRFVESLVDLGEHCDIAGKGDRAKSVDRRYRNGPRMSFDQARRFLAGNPRRQHPALSGGSILQPAAMESDPNGILQRKHAGDVRRRHFTRAMAQDRGRLDAPRSPQCCEPDLQRKNRRLPDAGLLNLRSRLVGGQLLQQGPAGERTEQLVHLLDRSAKGGLLREQLAPHRPPLLAHARADEDGIQRHARGAAGRAVGASFSPQTTPRAAPPTRP